MHNQHAGLSQQLAAQHITQRLEQAAQARLAHGAGRPRRRRRWWLARRWWQLARRPGVATQPPVRYPHRVRWSEAPMSKLARALILAVMVAVLPLAGLTAIAHAQANDQHTTSQQELADNWNYYYQATHIPPAELKARMQDEVAQRKLADRWSYYSHATQMSPAELKAWLQARDRVDTPTEPPAPVQPDQPSGQPAWLVVSLGGLAVALAVVAGLALLAARRANRRAQVRPAA